jgi:hypothetical protein
MSHLCRGARIGTALGAAALVASCSGQAPGYRSFLDPCGLVGRQTISKLVGAALMTSGRQLPRRGVEDAERDSCMWRTRDGEPPTEGGFVSATLELDVERYQNTFGSPDIDAATREAGALLQRYHMSKTPPESALGDESGESHTEAGGAQIGYFCLRKANVVVLVKYSGVTADAARNQINHTSPQNPPVAPAQLEKNAHDVAVDVLNNLGPLR